MDIKYYFTGGEVDSWNFWKRDFEITVDPRGPYGANFLVGFRLLATTILSPKITQKIRMENKVHTLDFSCTIDKY